MCVGKPKAPSAADMPKIPDRRASVLPDGGDPSVRMANRRRRQLMPSMMIFAKQGRLGAPSVTTPSTTLGG